MCVSDGSLELCRKHDVAPSGNNDVVTVVLLTHVINYTKS